MSTNRGTSVQYVGHMSANGAVFPLRRFSILFYHFLLCCCRDAFFDASDQNANRPVDLRRGREGGIRLVAAGNTVLLI